jgi:hypothetical protein
VYDGLVYKALSSLSALVRVAKGSALEPYTPPSHLGTMHGHYPPPPHLTRVPFRCKSGPVCLATSTHKDPLGGISRPSLMPMETSLGLADGATRWHASLWLVPLERAMLPLDVMLLFSG